jgi:hypothetical protein
MGSSTSRPRKGHEHPTHLPKVGSAAELTRWHEARYRQVFGPLWVRGLVVVAATLALVSLALLFF